MGVRRGFFASAIVICVGIAVGHAQTESTRRERWTFVGPGGRTITLQLEAEVVADPATSTIFSYPGNVFVNPADDSIYWMDGGDRNVKVFDRNLELRMVIGRRGQGPGEFTFPWLAVFRGQDSYIYDREADRLTHFDGAGTFVAAAAANLATQTRMKLCGMAWLDDGTLALAAPSRQELGAGFTLHRFALHEADGDLELRHVGSSYAPPLFEPAIDRAVLDCTFAKGLNGEFTLGFATPYWVSAWTADGRLRWEHRGSDVLPPATEYFRLNPMGRVEFGEFPRSVKALQVAHDLYLHFMSFPDPDNVDRDPGEWEYLIKYELLRTSGSEVVETYELSAMPFRYSFSATDSQGLLLGHLLDEGETIPMRFTLDITRGE